MPNELVSIVMPTRNYGHFIGETLRSVAAQTYPHIETIVIDDGSTDGTQDVLAGFPVVSLRTDGVGAAAARNAGLDRAAGNFVMFLDSDDLLEPDAIEALVAADADVAIGQWRNFADDPAIGEVHACARNLFGFANVICTRPFPGGVLFRRPLERFDPSLIVSEHLDFLLRVGRRRPSAGFVDHPVVAARQHKSAHRLTVAHDHFDPVHRLDIVKRHRHDYVGHDRHTIAALDHLTMTIALQKYRVGHGLDPVANDVDFQNMAAQGILPSTWNLLRFGGIRAGLVALRAYEAVRS